MQAEAGGEGGVGEGAIAVVVVERGSVVGEICLEDVEPAIAVVVGNRGAHAGLGAAVFVERSSGNNGNVGKGAVAIVAVQNAGSAVAGDVEIGPAVVVVIERGDAEGVVAGCVFDAAFLADVFKFSAAQVVIQDVARRLQAARAAHHRRAFPDATGT